MDVRYRTHTHAPMSPLTWHHARVENNSQSMMRFVQTIPITAISTLELIGELDDQRLDVSAIFYLLQHLPNLEDLMIEIDTRAPPTLPHALPILPFRLRRLNVHPVFPGTVRLLYGSAETLQCLVLGEAVGRSHAAELGNLARFQNLRALRSDTNGDERFIASAGRRLSALAIAECIDPDLMPSLCRQLARLTVVYGVFDETEANTLAADLELFPLLRTLEIETDDDEDGFSMTSDPARQELAEVCRRRRIRVSIMPNRTWADWARQHSD